MPIIIQVVIIVILVLTCFITALVTGYSARVIRAQIKETKTRLSVLKRDNKESHSSQIKKLESSLDRLENELEEIEKPSLLPASSGNTPLSEKIRSAAPFIVMIIVGVILGAVLIVLVPIILLMVLFTIATFVGSTGVFLEVTRNERKVLVLSAVPAVLYAVTQILNVMNLFEPVFWLFDSVVVLALIGVAMIIGKELPIEIVIIILAILSIWDIYAVLLSRIMVTAVVGLENTLFSVQIPMGTGQLPALIGGGDLFFSYLLVTAFTRKLKEIPYALIGLIAASISGLTVIMYVIGLEFAPALPSVLIAALLSTVFYRGRLTKSA